MHIGIGKPTEEMVMRNDKRERMARTILAVFVAWTLLFSGIVGLGASFIALAGEEPIEPLADWNCNSVVTVSGDIKLDGDLNLMAGCVLTVLDGGISFVQDYSHRYSLNINLGATMNLTNSYLTVETNQIEPYLSLPVNVDGTLVGWNAILQFPGFINVTGTIELWDSEVTNLIPPGWVSDPNGLLNDAPVFAFASGEGQFYRTTIDPYFTTTAFPRTDVNRGWMYDFNVTGASEVWLVDTYLDIDYSALDSDHNVLQVGDNARVYAYNMTIDTSYSLPSRRGAIQATGTGIVHILRWANVLCVDNAGVPIETVSLDPLLVQTGARPNFPDSLGQTPHSYILSYLGVTAGTWFVTGPNGKAMLPLLSEYIDSGAGQGPPNSEFYGPYEVTGTYDQPPILTSAVVFSFDPYPAMDPVDGTADVTLVFDTFRPKPDLVVTDIRWDPPGPFEGANITFEADVYNQGLTGANDVYVCFYVDSTPLNNTPTLIPFIGNDTTVTTPDLLVEPPVYWADSTGDNHSVLVVADCPGLVSEEIEDNNGLTETLYVIPLLPDYEITPDSITFPVNSYIGNPVQMDITISNPGNDLAPENTVVIYIGDPTLGGAQEIGEVPISNITAGLTTKAVFYYTFDTAQDYKICVVVDEDDLVREELETNNVACKILTVELAPNLAVTANDIGVGDPCTRMGQTVTPQAVVRNNGYVDAGAYEVLFSIDGTYFASGNSTGLSSNASETISADLPWIPANAGMRVLSVQVDKIDAVKESTNVDNLAIKEILVFHNKVAATYSTPGLELDASMTYHGNVDITGGSLTIDGKSVFIQQADPLTGRYCIKVLGNGELILKNGASLTSNYPLVVYVSDSASLTVDDSDIDLDIQGTGGLFADQSGVVEISNSVLNGNLFSTGNHVTLDGVDLLGVDLYIEAAETSYIWDTLFTGVQNIYLLSDDGDVNTVDFDLRNITDFIDPLLDAQLVFKGNQLVELTNVDTYIPPGEEWWTGMITERSKGRLLWWLTVRMVDGTGAVLQTLTPEMDLETLDAASLLWTPVQGGTGIAVPNGEIVLRALSEEIQFYPTWGWANSTYAITARVQVAGSWFYPDTVAARGNWTGDLRTNLEVELRFSGLTPDFSVSMIAFVGDGLDSNQPLDRQLQIEATIYNSGNIAANGVEVTFFHGSEIIGYDKIDIPAKGSAVAVAYWTPNSIGAKVILVHVDFNNTVPERDEFNNELSAGLNVFGWPDLSVNSGEILFATDPVEQTPGDVTATLRNLGTSNAVNAVVTFADDDGWSDTVVIPLIVVGASQDATVQWTPSSAGTHGLNVSVNASNLDIYQTDYDQSNNEVNLNVLVLTLPDLYVGDVTGAAEVTVGVSYDIAVTLNNSGGSTAWGVELVLILDNLLPPVAEVFDLNITAGGSVTLTITCPVINDIGTHTITAKVDPNDLILELSETNNSEPHTFEVVPPSAYISISTPVEEQRIKGETDLLVEGWVKELVTDRGIEGVELLLTLQLLDGTPIGVEQYTVSREGGKILTSFEVPVLDCEEDMNFVVFSNASYVVISYTTVLPEECEVIWLTPEVILILIIIIIVIVIIAAITAYIKIFGLGKLVECGECGAFIPEDSTACPKCGVQFETETAKCSSCQAWIPVKVKKCPECGVEFATGEVEMEDYKKKMRMQYDEVKGKLKKAAQQELGKSLTNAEFEDWWKTQPTFVTFEQWLKQEEDMRKMGSKPCPSCGTLNSVTTTVCHKCGALMAEDEKPRRPPSRPPAEKKPAEAVPAQKEAVTPGRPGTEPRAAGAPPAAVRPVAKKTLPSVERPVPKKVIKKPVVEGAPTVVPKKVVKKPEEEEEEGGGGY
jgi:subtilase family serine protease/RNA polymerase subunit RPABC4/transcription elongation factor Spt4